jgi:hypothetical protein
VDDADAAFESVARTGDLQLVGVVLVGAAIVLWNATKGSAKKPPAVTQPDKAAGLGADVEARLTRLERDVRSRPPRVALAAPSASVDVFVEDEPRPTPEELHARVERGRATREAQFLAEYPDRGWSAVAQRKVTTVLETIAAPAGFELEVVECRTSLCRANLRWKSYSEAMANWKTVLVTSTGMQCQNEMFVPPPIDPSAAYSASAFFDCTDERTK